MEFEQLIASRRSIRKYISNKEIKDETVYKILDAARLCQSAKNRQPWLFTILKGNDKNSIASMMLNYCKNNKDLKGNSSRATAESIVDASILILVLKKPDKNWDIGDNLSIGAAIEHICLEATNLGLGALWIRDTTYVEDEIMRYIDRTDLELISSIAIGYPDEKPPMRPRKSLNDIIINRGNY